MVKYFLFALFFISCNALATEPQFPPQAIAEIVKYGSSTLSLRIWKNGSVDMFVNGLLYSHVAMLGRTRVEAIKRAANRLNPEALTFNGDEGGACNDPSTTLYRVGRAQGDVVTLVKIENCRKYRMAHHADRELKHVLQGLEALANL